MWGWERRTVSMWRGRRIVRIGGVRRGHHPTRHTCEGKPHELRDPIYLH